MLQSSPSCSLKHYLSLPALSYISVPGILDPKPFKGSDSTHLKPETTSTEPETQNDLPNLVTPLTHGTQDNQTTTFYSQKCHTTS